MASSSSSFLTGGFSAPLSSSSPTLRLADSPFAAASASPLAAVTSSPFATSAISAALQPAFIQPSFSFPPIIGPLIPTLPPIVQQPPPPPSPTASASDLQVMISAIPIAQDGHVITADFHNALRLALVAIANRMGIGPVAEEITITNAPRLHPVAGAAPWSAEYGLVRKPASMPEGMTNVRGWMEMELPDGARIKKMVAYASRSGVGTLRVKLTRQQITDPAIARDLIVITIGADADPTKGTEGDVTLPGIGAGAATIEEFRIVNNREQKYLLEVEFDGPNSDSNGQVNAVQVVLGK
jgi:hypothetical protein